MTIKSLLSLLAIAPSLAFAADGDVFNARINGSSLENTKEVSFTILSEVDFIAQIGDGKNAVETKAGETFAIPDEVTNDATGKTYRVIAVGANAFAGSEANTIVVPSSVWQIKERAFYQSNISSLWLRADDIEHWGKDAFAGLGNNSKVFVPLIEKSVFMEETNVAESAVNGYFELKQNYMTFSYNEKFMTADFEAYNPYAGYTKAENTLQAYWYNKYEADGNTLKDENATHKITPAYTGLLLKGQDVHFLYVVKPYKNQDAEAAFDAEDNLLKGSGDGRVPVYNLDGFSMSHHRFYVFSFKEGKYAFWRCSGGTLSSYKAYLDLGGDFGPYGIYDINMETDAIDDYVEPVAKAAENTIVNDITSLSDNNTVNEGSWYTLGGVRLTTAPTTQGIYIHNGKKIVIK